MSINDDVGHISELLGSPPRAKRDVAPFWFIGSVAKTLFGTVDEDEMSEMQNYISAVENNTLKVVDLLVNQTRVVEIELERNHREISEIIRGITGFELRLQEELHRRDVFLSILSQLDRHIQEYDEDTQVLTNSVIFAKTGQLHPRLVPISSLLDSAQTIQKENQKNLFPVPMVAMSLSELTKISVIKTYYLREKLVYSIEIPMLDLEDYKLFKNTPVPVVQKETEDYAQIAYIQPESDFTFVSNDYCTYFRLSTVEKQECKMSLGRLLCQNYNPVFVISQESDCVVRLISRDKFKNFKGCNVRVRPLYLTYWLRTESKNTWFFTAPKPESVRVTCPAEETTFVQVVGTGLLRLRNGCSAKTDFVTLTAFKQIITRKNFTLLKSPELKMEYFSNLHFEKIVGENIGLQDIINDLSTNITSINLRNDNDLKKGSVALDEIIDKARSIARYQHLNNGLNIVKSTGIFGGLGLLSVLVGTFVLWKCGVFQLIAPCFGSLWLCMTRKRQYRPPQSNNGQPIHDIENRHHDSTAPTMVYSQLQLPHMEGPPLPDKPPKYPDMSNLASGSLGLMGNPQ